MNQAGLKVCIGNAQPTAHDIPYESKWEANKTQLQKMKMKKLGNLGQAIPWTGYPSQDLCNSWPKTNPINSMNVSIATMTHTKTKPRTHSNQFVGISWRIHNKIK